MIYAKKSDLLEAASKIMRFCEDSGYCFAYKKWNEITHSATPTFDEDAKEYELPLGYVEGCPVFVGDELHDVKYGGKFPASINTRFDYPWWSWQSANFQYRG